MSGLETAILTPSMVTAVLCWVLVHHPKVDAKQYLSITKSQIKITTSLAKLKWILARKLGCGLGGAIVHAHCG